MGQAVSEPADATGQGPAPRAGSAPLSRGERWRVAAAALAPVGLVGLGLVPVAAWTGAGAGELLGATIVYGGLLGLASGFVYVDRVHARQCPRCSARNPRDAKACDRCGYDLGDRPQFSCSEGHRIYVEPGLCSCGRRLRRREVARGIGPEVAFILRVGAWLLAFLFGAGLLLRFLPS